MNYLVLLFMARKKREQKRQIACLLWGNDTLGTTQILRNQKGGWVGKVKCLRLLTW